MLLRVVRVKKPTSLLYYACRFSSQAQAPEITRPDIKDPNQRPYHKYFIKKAIERRHKDNLPFPRTVSISHCWDSHDYVPFKLNGKDTSLMMIKRNTPSDEPPISERFKEVEDKLGYQIPEEYKSFLDQYEKCHGIKTPVHVWGTNHVNENNQLQGFHHAHNVQFLNSYIDRWRINNSREIEHKHEWQSYPAVVIGTFAGRHLALFLANYKNYKKGSMYSFKSGDWNDFRFVAESFEDFCSRIFTDEEEEEFQHGLNKIRTRPEEQRKYKRLVNPSIYEYNEPAPSSINADQKNLHRHRIHREAESLKKSGGAQQSTREKYGWNDWDWKYLAIGEKYTKVAIHEDQHHPLSQEQLKSVEIRLCVSFPKDYQKFLLNYDGVSVRQPGHIWQADGFVAAKNIEYIYGSENITSVANSKTPDPKFASPSICIAGSATHPSVMMFTDDFQEYKKGSVWSLNNNRIEHKIADSFTEFCNNFLTEEEEEILDKASKK